ncbi:MAG TPA: O-antigen ligase family protein, partial [Candidatus Bathyarchaeia archaeon]|nr:O-antigen ligase family protein [Candidatus Bathyarchaeia archaeon]
MNPTQAQSHSQVLHVLDAVQAIGVGLLLGFGPLALGATEEWAIFFIEEGVVLLFLIWALRGFIGGGVEFAVRPLLVPMVLFAALVGAQLLLHRTAYWYATWQKALLWTAYGALFFLTAQRFRSGVWLRRLGVALTTFGFLLAMFAILQKFAGNGKIYWVLTNQAAAEFFGPYANHSHYAGLMEMLIAFPLVLSMMADTAPALRVLFSFAALIMGSSIFLSKSRGGVIAFIIELAVLTMVFAQGQQRATRLRLWAGLALLLIACVLLVRPHGLWDRFAEVSNRADKARDENRLTMLEDSLRLVRARPLLGWGFGTFSAVYPQYRSFYTELMVNAAHDDFLEVTVETGLVGLGLAVAF